MNKHLNEKVLPRSSLGSKWPQSIQFPRLVNLRSGTTISGFLFLTKELLFS